VAAARSLLGGGTNAPTDAGRFTSWRGQGVEAWLLTVDCKPGRIKFGSDPRKEPGGSGLGSKQHSPRAGCAWGNVSRQDDYIRELRTVPDRIAFLRARSGLPGPRGNLELMQAAADVGDEPAFREWITIGSGDDPTDEFLAMCGIVGLGRLVAEGRMDLVRELHEHASDPRWRVREAAAMALQRVGDADTDRLFRIVRGWIGDRAYVQRAVIAAVSEPRLLKTQEAGQAGVDLVDRVTANLERMSDRRSDEFRTLRQALAYCWSVVVAAHPSYGKPLMERWIASTDPDVRRLMRENLRKTRLVRLDPAWVERMSNKL